MDYPLWLAAVACWGLRVVFTAMSVPGPARLDLVTLGFFLAGLTQLIP